MYNIHIAFGFHVNCYHSYRGDTNDDLGFGSDIRIIRDILDTLDEFNSQGVPVKGTWDFENAFSLENVLPEYAPDIIERVRDRQHSKGDENILMGYNNGAMSAMTEDEFLASIQWAVSNPCGSGLGDIFGDCAMVIRPQEVMFTPSQVPLYNRAGVNCLCLYYSCVPFDAFRTIIPQLEDEYAFNPVNFIYEGKSLTVLPTYSHSDIIDAGSLRYLCQELHRQQVAQDINHDLIIFINIDADSFLWEPLPVPGFMKNVPNTGGLAGLIRETMDLDYVVYDTPGNYLKNHGPIHDITFNEDVADGNFTGYASWSEKPFNRQIWTRLERARSMARMADADRLSPSFEDRVRLLSTTHFGLASPVMNITREHKALELSEHMVQQEKEYIGTRNSLTILNTLISNPVGFEIAIDEGKVTSTNQLVISDMGLKSYFIYPMDFYQDGSVKDAYVQLTYDEAKRAIAPKFTISDIVCDKIPSTTSLSAGDLRLDVADGKIKQLRFKDTVIGAEDFLKSHIEYDGKDIEFGSARVEDTLIFGKAQALTLAGEIHLPKELISGSYRFSFIVGEFDQEITLVTQVNYPYTLEDHEISTSSSSLGRYSDNKWQQVMPFEMTPMFSRDIEIKKRNFMNHTAAYPVSDFWNSIPDNQELDSFNHHLSAGMVGVIGDDIEFIVANARQTLCSMAHCPMRLRKAGENHRVSMNMFGTYFGKQRRYPTRGNGAMQDMYVLTMPQARSLAPSYNGCSETAVMKLFACDRGSYEDIRYKVEAFADGVVLLDAIGGFVHPNVADHVTFQDAKLKPTPDKLQPATAAAGGSTLSLLSAGFKVIRRSLYAKRHSKKG